MAGDHIHGGSATGDPHGFAGSGIFWGCRYQGRRAPEVALALGYKYVAPLGLSAPRGSKGQMNIERRPAFI